MSHPGPPTQPNAAMSRMSGPPQFGQTRPISQSGLYSTNGGPPPQHAFYQNGSAQMLPGNAQGSAMPNINAEIREMQMHLKTYTESGEKNPEVSKKIVEVKGKLENLLRQQAASAAGYPPMTRMPYGPPPGQPLGPNRPPPPSGGTSPSGLRQMMAMQPHHISIQPHQMRPTGMGMDISIQRPPGPPHGPSANTQVCFVFSFHLLSISRDFFGIFRKEFFF
jgi:hypothetical protein